MESKRELIKKTERVREEIVALIRALDGANNRLFAALNKLKRNKISRKRLVEILREISEDSKFISPDREAAVHDIRDLVAGLIADRVLGGN